MTPKVRTDNKKQLLLAAAIRVFAAEGLSATTASIAKEAGVGNGTLFNNFATKVDLLNELYLLLKVEVIAVALTGLPKDASLREQVYHAWTQWTHWGAAYPDKRRTLSLLCMTDEITTECVLAAQSAGQDIGGLIMQFAASGHLRDMPFDYVMGVTEALAGLTIDFMIANPEDADKHSDVGFETYWRALS